MTRIVVDVARHEVKVDGNVRQLAPKEFEIVALLARANGKIVTREQMLRDIWGVGEDVDVDALAVAAAVYRLRKKIGDDAILTVPCHGFKSHGITITEDQRDNREVPLDSARALLAHLRSTLKRGQTITIRVS